MFGIFYFAFCKLLAKKPEIESIYINQILLKNVYNLFKGKAEQYNCRSFAAASK